MDYLKGKFRDALNGENLFEQYGLVIQTGTAELLEFPERKTGTENDWREIDGKEYDLGLVKFKDKEVSLVCGMMAGDDQGFWSNYNAFFAALTQSGWQELTIDDHSKTYEVFYKKTGHWEKMRKRLKEVEKVFVKFNLSLIVK